jgi:hypothetical protein
MISVHHRVTDLVEQINNSSQTKQIFLALIFADQNETDVRVFLMRNVPNQDRLHSLFLIFPNGIRYHEQWLNTPAMPKLKWCRSFTTQLIWDLREVGQIACNQHISFYEQRRIQADDNIDRNMINNAKSIAALFARKKKEYSMFLFNYLQMRADSNENLF